MLDSQLYFNADDQQAYQFGVEHYEYDKEGYYKNKINSDYTIDTITDTLFFNTQE